MSKNIGDESDSINKFNQHLEKISSNIWGKPLRLKKYQLYVAKEILEALKSHNFIVVSMPTGSGKTLIEEFIAFYVINQGFDRVLVLEPVRFLCDQMYRKQWSVVFGEIVGKEYEGRCDDFLDPTKRIVISTPQTALKCASTLPEAAGFNFIIIDEVHHAFGNKYYRELIKTLKPKLVIGFTALLPSDKLLSGPDYREILGSLKLLHYDFKKLKEIDPDFQPPLAVVDIYDSEFDEDEEEVYHKLMRNDLLIQEQLNAFLLRTLVSYGRKAFCESSERIIGSRELTGEAWPGGLCRSPKYSHKVRTLLHVLEAYDALGRLGRLSIVYTTRKATAYEAYEAVEKQAFGGVTEVLTGDMSREERLDLLNRLREGRVKLLVSTRVGEEGIDLPEAWLLVMLDIVKSPLRFYQRIGRLIRIGSPEKLKHLVLALTPGTYEYDNLEEVLWRLYEEGVDVSYILTNIDLTGKTTVDHVVDMVAKVEEQLSAEPSIPLLIYGRGPDSYNFIRAVEELSKSSEFKKAFKEVWKHRWGVEIDESSFFLEYHIITALWSLIGLRELRRKLLEELGISKIKRNKLYKIINEAIRKGKLYYIYDVDALADIIEFKLAHMYKMCLEKQKHVLDDYFFRLDTKELLRYFTVVFTQDKLDSVTGEVEKTVKTCMGEINELESLAAMNGSNIEVRFWVENNPIENGRQKALIYKAFIILRLRGCHISIFDAQFNYYDIDPDILVERDKLLKLFQLNTKAAICKGIANFLEKELVEHQLEDKDKHAA
jgi:superfamily II DNA or RNA helicase